METVVGIWLGLNAIITIIQLGNALENYYIEYSVWEYSILIVRDVWDEMEMNYNLAGRIIIAVILSILTLPAIITTAAIIFVCFVVFGLPWEIFYLIFKKR